MLMCNPSNNDLLGVCGTVTSQARAPTPSPPAGKLEIKPSLLSLIIKKKIIIIIIIKKKIIIIIKNKKNSTTV